MYLKSLELQGFKSFPDKTKLTFEGGATVIVGPNGSGKSNISDAMRWVLGEVSSRSIRGQRMEDIIFGGADSRRPMGYAEVSVTFDNTGMIGKLDCPYDEVTVTRRYYRSGESEYFINRRAVRLKDIYEMFMNTGVGRDGYSIIGQGKIAEIVSAKSDERRSIFEDASGIAKYRHKKNETERKLASTEDNMTRINDVFTEVSAQVIPLEKEAEKAKRAIELLEIKKKVDVQLWIYDTEKLRDDISVCEDNYKRLEFDLNTIEDSIKTLEVQNNRLFEVSQSKKTEAAELLEQIRACTEDNHSLDSEYRIAQTNILHAKELIAGAQGSKESAKKSVDAENAQIDARLARIEELKRALDAKESEHNDAAEQRNGAALLAQKLEFDIDRALGDIRISESELADVNARISFIENSRSDDQDKNAAMLEQLAKYEEGSASMKKDINSLQKTVTEYDEMTAASERISADAEEKLSGLYADEEELEATITADKLRADSVRQRIDTIKSMEEQFEGYSGSVRFIMKKYAEGKVTDKRGQPCGKIYGPLSKLIEVEDRYVTAIETALAANLQHVVVEDENVAKAAMFTLKREEAGRATFFPLTSMKPQSVTDEMRDAFGCDGFIAVADELIKCESKFDNVISSLLGRTLIFDTIENATEMAKAVKYRVKAVTLDGQQINVGGSFTGGSFKNKGTILGRMGEIKRLEAELSEMDKKSALTAAELAKLKGRIEELESEQSDAEQKISIIKIMRDSENTRLEQLTAKLEANETLMVKLRDDYEQQLRAREKYEEDRENLIAKRAELQTRIKEINDARAELDIRRSAELDRKAELESRMTEIYISVTEARKDIETENTLIAESKTRIDGFMTALRSQDGYVAEMEAKIAEYESECTENRKHYAEGERLLAELSDKRAAVEQDGFEFDRKLNELNMKMREKMLQKETVIKEYTRFENRLSNLRAEQDKLAGKLFDEHELTKVEALGLGYPALTKETRCEAAAKQTECRNKLRAIGNVDLDAVNKYKEVKARYDYMEGQIKDLEAAKADLTDIITKLEGEMEISFVSAFEKINENFNKTFSELFGGGSASLSLTDPENVLTSGIEIKAAPPGKIIKNMVQLSGGEQAFVAIALFFAILQVNPTPFCILDEIEAALDEVNVARFAEYIKRYSSGTQFIMITHRRGTMEAANRLYGVTMPERGISKILELDINDITKKKGEDWDGIFG